jgi:hypothetical protein
MPGAKINKIEIQGFRAFGREPQSLVFDSGLAIVWGPNSQGKTSLAEAFEFLLTGTIVRRELLASTQDEFADSLRNVHLPPGTPVFVRAEVHAIDGKLHTVKRTLVSDFGKREDCKSLIEIDASTASEADLAKLGLVLSQPPLRAPILAQHSLGYLFSVGPLDRANYFKALLEVTDVDSFRAAVAELERDLAPVESPPLVKLEKAEAIPVVGAALAGLRTNVVDSREVEDAIAEALRSLIESAGRLAPDVLSELANAVEGLLEEARARTFPLRLLGSRQLASWEPPPTACWEELAEYLSERTKVDEEVHRLAGLFAAALRIPDVARASGSLDCPLCGAKESLTPQRIAFIRERISSNEEFARVEAAAKRTLEQIERAAALLTASTKSAGPEFLVADRAGSRRAGFTLLRVQQLLGEEHAGLLTPWISALRALARARRVVLRASARASREVGSAREALANLASIDSLKELVAQASSARAQLQTALDYYAAVEDRLLAVLRAAVDSGSKTSGWGELIALAQEPAALVRALAENQVRQTVAYELQKALKDIDRAIEKVWREKFAELSTGVGEWWNLLRPDEPTFFDGVAPRAGARRTIDLKAAMSAREDRTDPHRREAVAVFSQSQLHCLGLSMFLARAVREGSGFVVLDEPVLASDDDYRAYFESSVLNRLMERSMQVVVITQDQRMWKNIEHRYLHHDAELFRIDGSDPARGVVAIKTSDDLAAMLARADLLRGGDPEIIKQKAALIRAAAERFCKELLVVKERHAGRGEAAIGDFDRRDLSYLEPRVSPLLISGRDHAGKLQAVARETNPGAHDDSVPTHGSLNVALGNLRELVGQYRPKSVGGGA